MKRRIRYQPGAGFYWLLEWAMGVSRIDWISGRPITFGEGVKAVWVGPLPTLDKAYRGSFV